GGGLVLLLAEICDADRDTGNHNIAWSLSPDYGVSWDVDPLAQFQAAIGAPGTHTGLLFAADAATGKFLTSNLVGNDYGAGLNPRHWNAVAIPGTSRVAMVYAGSDSNGQTPGLRYCEFDAAANGGLGGWTAQGSHVLLSAYRTESQPQVLAEDDGTVRVVW